METKGLLDSWMGEPTEERGGKARRLVRVRPEGRELLMDSRRAMDTNSPSGTGREFGAGAVAGGSMPKTFAAVAV